MITTKGDWERASTHNWVDGPLPGLFQCSKCTMIEHTETPVENIPGCPGLWTTEIAKMNKRYMK